MNKASGCPGKGKDDLMLALAWNDKTIRWAAIVLIVIMFATSGQV